MTRLKFIPLYILPLISLIHGQIIVPTVTEADSENGLYQGELQNGLAEGYGVMNWMWDGTSVALAEEPLVLSYTGSWRNGVPGGEGELSIHPRDIYK